MRRVLPHPLLSASLALTWLVLNAPVKPGTVVLALAFGLAVPAVMRALRPEPVRLRAPLTILRLALVVLGDVVRSNLDVAAIILGLRGRGRRTGYVWIPLDMTNRYGLAALAIILTGAPGTLWVQYDAGHRCLLLHVLDLTDGAEWIARVKDRYERPLMEIFA